MQTTQLAVNPEKLINNLRFSFTQATTVLGELMQNARRAGATFVSLDYDAHSQTLTVCDDGCGIESLQTLLTVAESGWDADIIERESTVKPEIVINILRFSVSQSTRSLSELMLKLNRIRPTRRSRPFQH
ncbi:ATP-binding protein [Methylomonas sp. LL1]|uniref:ATP-binding protein n=1 Tax=Methylomonas sp. LL1 TaxID=2785785 RepID=UPI0018C39F51|nr:ATP-binding protein [Methylomonas sp. LL1]QPK62890.1 ATP-binding protein [Methylomonas sp. LL1]